MLAFAALIAIGCTRTAAVTARAIAARGSASDELLHQCDGEHYAAGEVRIP